MLSLALIGVVACSSEEEPRDTPFPLLELGRFCQLGQPELCASGVCIGDFQGLPICSKDCTNDADCSGNTPVCGSDLHGRRVCVFQCPSTVHPGFTCETGARAALPCGIDAALCQECACPEAERCEVGVGCKSVVGNPCTTSGDCFGGGCIGYDVAGVFSGLCRKRCAGPYDQSCPTRCKQTSSRTFFCE
jgi:hypothetical protein